MFGGIIVQPTTDDTFGQTEVSDFDIVTYSSSPFLCGFYGTQSSWQSCINSYVETRNSKSGRFPLDQRGMELMLLIFAPWVNSSETHFINLLQKAPQNQTPVTRAVAKLETHLRIVFSSFTVSSQPLPLILGMISQISYKASLCLRLSFQGKRDKKNNKRLLEIKNN